MDEKIETLYDLCETISRELEDVNSKIRSAGGGMSAGDLELVDKLTHALKSIKTTIAMMESDDSGYSNRYMPHGMSYAGGRSYARNRKRDSMGRYSREYSREGGYSYADSMASLLDEMRGMMDTLPEDKRRKAERLVNELSM